MARDTASVAGRAAPWHRDCTLKTYTRNSLHGPGPQAPALFIVGTRQEKKQVGGNNPCNQSLAAGVRHGEGDAHGFHRPASGAATNYQAAIKEDMNYRNLGTSDVKGSLTVNRFRVEVRVKGY